MLNKLDIPKAIIDTELAAMTEHVVTKTANRSVVGMLNEYSFLGERFLDPDTDLHALSIRLADTPCGPLYKSTSYPNSEVRLRLLGETPEWVKRKNEAPTLDAKPATSETPTRRNRHRAINKPINRVLTRNGRTTPGIVRGDCRGLSTTRQLGQFTTESAR